MLRLTIHAHGYRRAHVSIPDLYAAQAFVRQWVKESETLKEHFDKAEVFEGSVRIATLAYDGTVSPTVQLKVVR